MKKILCIVMALMSITGAIAQNYDGIIYVSPNGAGTHSGNCWANATSSFSQALLLAKTHNCIVWVAAGIYYGNTIGASAFTMIDGVNVYGGFAGNESPDFDLSLRDFEENTTILDGQDARRVLSQDSSFNNSTIWDGFTIRNGSTTSGQYGAGAYLIHNSTLNNCVISNNASRYFSYGGSAVFLSDGCSMTNCKVCSNDGNGIYTNYGIVKNCDIFNNNGMGVLANGTTMSNCEIFNNQGSGVEAYFSNITNCIITHNTNSSTAYYSGGGGVYAGNSVLNNCVITHNTAKQGGGIYAIEHVVINNCKLSHNRAESGKGGGILSFGSFPSITISNCEISNNYASQSGGGVDAYGDCQITNSTIVRNSANICGAIGSSHAHLVNCIIWGNEGINSSYDGTSYSYSAVEENISGEHNINISGTHIFVNPSLIAGTDDTTENVNWQLLPESPCINSGSNESVIDSFDLSGIPRVLCGTVDMGCFEYYNSIIDEYVTSDNYFTWHGINYTEDGNYVWADPESSDCDVTILHLTITTGINNDFPENYIDIYPNPTKSFVSMRSNKYGDSLSLFQIFDIYGKLLQSCEIINNNIHIDFSNYPDGIYILKLLNIDGHTIAVKKIVKKL